MTLIIATLMYSYFKYLFKRSGLIIPFIDKTHNIHHFRAILSAIGPQFWQALTAASFIVSSILEILQRSSLNYGVICSSKFLYRTSLILVSEAILLTYQYPDQKYSNKFYFDQMTVPNMEVPVQIGSLRETTET